MNLLKSAGFFLKFLVSSCVFSLGFGKNLGKRGIFTNESLTQKMCAVKSTLVEREFSFHLPAVCF
jgi:hypothetical protein